MQDKILSIQFTNHLTFFIILYIEFYTLCVKLFYSDFHKTLSITPISSN